MTSFNYLKFLDASRGQTTCDIISTNLTTLTTDGGVIFNGTQNVIIYYLCMRDNVAVGGARWFFPNRNQVRTETHWLTRPNGPYYKNVIPTPLIIQKFVHPYIGTYGCGHTRHFSTVSVTINLTLAGMNSLIVYVGKLLKLYYISIIIITNCLRTDQ